jgi:putative membrane protein
LPLPFFVFVPRAMIVRERPSGLRPFLLLRGSILGRIRGVLLVNILLAVLVTWTHGRLFTHAITLTTIPLALMGLPLAIFLGFRNSAAYNRYWEARKLWGELLLRSRNLARQVLSLLDVRQPLPARAAQGPELDDVRVRIVYRAIAFAQALKHLLRNTPDAQGEVQALLRPQDWAALQGQANRSASLMLQMGEDLRLCRQAGQLDSVLRSSPSWPTPSSASMRWATRSRNRSAWSRTTCRWTRSAARSRSICARRWASATRHRRCSRWTSA